MTLAELDELDFGSWHASYPGRRGAAPSCSRLLTLERLLGAVRDSGRRVRLLIETKHPSRYGAEVERRLIQMLRRFGLADPKPDDPVQVTVMSFAALALRRVRVPRRPPCPPSTCSSCCRPGSAGASCRSAPGSPVPGSTCCATGPACCRHAGGRPPDVRLDRQRTRRPGSRAPAPGGRRDQRPARVRPGAPETGCTCDTDRDTAKDARLLHKTENTEADSQTCRTVPTTQR